MPAISKTETSEAQRKFNETYISTSEMIEMLGVSRTAIHTARTTGKLPNPICIHGQIFVWERAKVSAYLDAWRLMLNTRRGARA
jgi:predicted DNA-binding transcriptional regulator AlpA